MVYVSDDEVTDVNELLARISESISEKCGYRTGYLRDTLSVERIVQRWPVGELEAWIIEELKVWDVSEHPQVAHLLSLVQELWPGLSSEAKTFFQQYCKSNVWNGTTDTLFNQLAAEISEGYLL
ncbi:hypothetical protein SAMN04487868_1421 [Marinobacter salarius]|jgi:hypothetical protein|uniref:Uncharacterized protein n=1 Tax=Marinobacter salarius TaxID=1420917 RepID=W5YW82_9GAMM|nr:hypothetical protein [Marinobacter salarius]AHI33492.1 hypothetical protein AU15_22215 [Marinobacter salarius]PHR00942.1 MAG: hypothetical protein COB32_11635 [Halomonas sp.]SFM15333.1 hypothetical protein SAMN04487868_1421 [Marinobacter salarius]|tara:strand:+ start:55 stop:426 length:372 start_codon:yes stop_codon:yes gene_type:complete